MTTVVEDAPPPDLAEDDRFEPAPEREPLVEKKERGRWVIGSPDLPDDLERRDCGGIVMLAAQVYTTGCDGADPFSLAQVATRLDAIVLDIRNLTTGQPPGWNGADLSKLLGARYKKFTAWSAMLYDDGWGLADWVSGREAFFTLLRRDRTGRIPSREGPPQSMILLGEALSPFDCHRQYVASRLRNLGGHTAVHCVELMLDLGGEEF